MQLFTTLFTDNLGMLDKQGWRILRGNKDALYDILR